ncbi:hypothetical protein [Micromonospora sp. NPDC049662]|uniref:hypothetical protein n=1 Tax=Micromonospora sp. NPDC049662 TaxID=3155397 RepID=UPI003447F89A
MRDGNPNSDQKSDPWRFHMPGTASAHETRFARTRPTLLVLRRQILDAIDTAHPNARACLPMPDMDLPRTYTLPKICRDLHANLFGPRKGSLLSDEWRRAFDTCTHGGKETVITVKELTYLWYQAVCAGKYRVEATEGWVNWIDGEKERIPLRIAHLLAPPTPAPAPVGPPPPF